MYLHHASRVDRTQAALHQALLERQRALVQARLDVLRHRDEVTGRQAKVDNGRKLTRRDLC